MAFLWDKIMQLWDKLMWLCNVFCSEKEGGKRSKEKYGLFLILKGFVVKLTKHQSICITKHLHCVVRPPSGAADAAMTQPEMPAFIQLVFYWWRHTHVRSNGGELSVEAQSKAEFEDSEAVSRRGWYFKWDSFKNSISTRCHLSRRLKQVRTLVLWIL